MHNWLMRKAGCAFFVFVRKLFNYEFNLVFLDIASKIIIFK